MDTKGKTKAEIHARILEIARDFYLYCETNLRVRDKDFQVVKFVPRPIQKKIIERVIADLEAERPIRYIILKARQEGVSTVIEALIYWWTATHKNAKAKIVAHDRETAGQLYEMFRRFYDNSNPLFKPSTKYNTRNDISFDNEQGTGLQSTIDTSSAENEGTGRGLTIQWLHGSEVAKWRNGSELVAGLMQAVPMRKNTAVFLESTANGIGDYFHKTWQAAKRGESPFTPLFFSWAEDPEYRMPVPKDFKLTTEEKELKRIYDLDDEQIQWRREKMKEFVDEPKKFFQEYPINDTEAFLASGEPRFNVEKLMKMEEKAFHGQTFELVEKKVENQRLFTAHQLPGAPLKVWEQPQESRKYVIGADVAEGVGGDYSVATVMDVEKCKTVARWRGDIEPADFGEILEQLGMWYNRALIACEINNHGLTTVQRLRDLHYDNIYRREIGIDERLETATSRLGWKTDVRSKPLMINALAEAIGKEKIEDLDPIFVNECLTYVIDDRGRTNAQDGCYDDTVISTAIALQVFEWSDVTKQRFNVQSRYPTQYFETRKRLQLLKKR